MGGDDIDGPLLPPRPERHALAGLILVIAEAAEHTELLGWMRECADDPADARRWWDALGYVLFCGNPPSMYADESPAPEPSDLEGDLPSEPPSGGPDDEDSPFADFD